MEIVFWHAGDATVGIDDDCVTVDWPGLEDWIDDEPEVREKLATSIAEGLSAFAEPFTLLCYEDECPDCRGRGEHRPECPSEGTDCWEHNPDGKGSE